MGMNFVSEVHGVQYEGFSAVHVPYHSAFREDMLQHMFLTVMPGVQEYRGAYIDIGGTGVYNRVIAKYSPLMFGQGVTSEGFSFPTLADAGAATGVTALDPGFSHIMVGYRGSESDTKEDWDKLVEGLVELADATNRVVLLVIEASDEGEVLDIVRYPTHYEECMYTGGPRSLEVLA